MSDANPKVPAPSALDQTPPLREMADKESLRELCEQIGLLHGIGVAIYDNEGPGESPGGARTRGPGLALVPPAALPPHCALRCSRHGEQDRCDATKANVARRLDEEGSREIRGCFTGLKYYAMDVRSGLDSVGVAVLGPFALVEDGPADGNSGDPPEGATAEQKADLDGLRARVKKISRDDLDKLARFVTASIELVLFSSLKNYLASKVHLESVNDSFRELQAKNRELRASYEKLKQLDTLKSNFLATVSHELRTPLTSIIGYGEMVLEGIGSKVQSKKNVETIVKKAEQLLQLINSILDMSKIESGRMDLNVDRVRLDEVVEDALASVRPQAKKKDLKLVAQIADDAPDFLADKYKLRQVLVNLLSNAVKFTPQGGKVRVTSKRSGKGPDALVVVTVQDSGVGIPPEHHAKIFERFYQVDNTSTRQYGGTGLGLPIVRHFVEMHGGTIRVESAPGEGTTFTFELPITPKPTRAA